MVPDDGGFALICDTDTSDARSRVTLFFKFLDCVVDTGFYRRDKFERVVFVPTEEVSAQKGPPSWLIRRREKKLYRIHLPRLRIDLGKFHLMGRNGLSISIEDQKSSARRALVDRANEDVIRGLHGQRHFPMLGYYYIALGIPKTTPGDKAQV